jgi:outer membrane protein OmpA-like peptidoglycan-associated protein
MKFPKLISSLVLVACVYSSNAQVSKWPLGFGPENSFGFAIGSDKTGDLYFVKSIYDDDNGFFIDKIMHTKLDENGYWAEPEMMLPPINDNFNNAVVGLSENADTLYLLGNYRAAHPRLRSGLSYAVKNEKNEWEIAGTIKLPQLQPVTEFYGFYVNTKQDVLLASFQTKKRNSDDIYIARLIDGKTGYSDLIPLPENINTKASEISPSISDDGKTLTFARFVKDENGSNYHLFSSQAIGDDLMQWTEPRPLSITYSENFDAYYWCCMDNIAFFSSDRDRPGLSAIYTFENISEEDLYAAIKMNTKRVAANNYWNSALKNPIPTARTLNGTVQSNVSELSSQKLALVSIDGDTLDQAIIDENGRFTFNNAPKSDDYQIALVDSPKDTKELNQVLVSLATNDGRQSENVTLNQLPKASTNLLQLETIENNLALQKLIFKDYREVDLASKVLSGKIESESTEFTYKKLALIAPNGDIIEMADVAEDGSFKFSNVPTNSDYAVKPMSAKGQPIEDTDKVFVSIMTDENKPGERVALNELSKASAGQVQVAALDKAIASRKMINNENVAITSGASTLNGKIESSSSEMTYQKLALIGANGDTLETADVAEDGTFQFANVPNDANYEVKVASVEQETSIQANDLISLQTENGVAINNIRMSQMPEIGSKLLQLEALNNQIASKVDTENALIAANIEASNNTEIADANATLENATNASKNEANEQIAEATVDSKKAANTVNNVTTEQAVNNNEIADANTTVEKATNASKNEASEQIADATVDSKKSANTVNNATTEQATNNSDIADANTTVEKATNASKNEASEQIADATVDSEKAANTANNATTEQAVNNNEIADANTTVEKATNASKNEASEQIADATVDSKKSANTVNNATTEQATNNSDIADANTTVEKATNASKNEASEQIADATVDSEKASNTANNATTEQATNNSEIADANTTVEKATNSSKNEASEQIAQAKDESNTSFSSENSAKAKTNSDSKSIAQSSLSTNEEGVSIYFDFNSTSLNQKAEYQLEQLKSKAISFSQIKASADTAGSKAYNQDLSDKRANTIAEFLGYSGKNVGLGEVISNSPEMSRRGIITLSMDALKDKNGELFSVILFHPFNNPNLESTSETNLAYTALLLKKHTELALVIKAHADTQGDAEYNLMLSKNRAEQIKSLLIQNGVNPNQITSKWFGETESINNCQVNDCSAEERALDRRTELQIIKP